MIQKKNKDNSWVDLDMLMSELTFHRNNAARKVKEYKKIENPTEWNKLECKEAVGEVVALEYFMAWCKDFSFTSKEVKDIIEEKERGHEQNC